MTIRKSLIGIWVVLSFISLLIDVACFWLAQHTPAALPGNHTLNYITIFLVSAPAPIGLAVVLTILGGVLTMLCWIWAGFQRATHQPGLGISDYASSKSTTAVSALKH